jgi:hypothetical protein
VVLVYWLLVNKLTALLLVAREVAVGKETEALVRISSLISYEHLGKARKKARVLLMPDASASCRLLFIFI